MGEKTRGNYPVTVCINKIPCKYQNTEVCKYCFKKDKYEVYNIDKLAKTHNK